ncbi:hypothetical protein [Streptomyces rubiginosohelvolus]|uniref:hypothetical protein n=1 Tax=Streptomyces rubiginosohelvolus TaxID=67362 RepID=UPI0036D0F8A2
MPASEADDLVVGAQWEVVELDGMVSASRVGQRERADLGRLEGLVRESVLPRAHPHTTARRRVLGEASGKPGQRRAGASIWNGSGAAYVPHAAIEGPQE